MPNQRRFALCATRFCGRNRWLFSVTGSTGAEPRANSATHEHGNVGRAWFGSCKNKAENNHLFCCQNQTKVRDFQVLPLTTVCKQASGALKTDASWSMCHLGVGKTCPNFQIGAGPALKVSWRGMHLTPKFGQALPLQEAHFAHSGHSFSLLIQVPFCLNQLTATKDRQQLLKLFWPIKCTNNAATLANWCHNRHKFGTFSQLLKSQTLMTTDPSCLTKFILS